MTIDEPPPPLSIIIMNSQMFGYLRVWLVLVSSTHAVLGAAEVAAVPRSGGDPLVQLLAIAAGLGLLVGVIWPLWALVRWPGRWRWVPLLPLAVLTFVILRIMMDTTRDPTSHNLWPFEVALSASVSVGCMLILTIVRLALRPRPD